MKIIKVLLALLFTLSIQNSSNAQGCSDAGFCTLHTLSADHDPSTLPNQFRFGAVNGIGDDGKSGVEPNIWSAQLEYSREFNRNFSMAGKITYMSESSPTITNNGLADIYLSGTYMSNQGLSFTAGLKVPLSDANDKFDSIDIGLPMPFQSSLGTFDVILAAGYEKNNFKFDVAYQQPLNKNDNTYLSTSFPKGAPFGAFQSTNQFDRAGDILLRASYDFIASKNWIITPSLLPVFHLANDKFTDSSGVVQEIEGSSGMTFNVNLLVQYVINKHNAIVLGAGVPAVSRDVKPEGMGRKFVINFDYKIMF